MIIIFNAFFVMSQEHSRVNSVEYIINTEVSNFTFFIVIVCKGDPSQQWKYNYINLLYSTVEKPEKEGPLEVGQC